MEFPFGPDTTKPAHQPLISLELTASHSPCNPAVSSVAPFVLLVFSLPPSLTPPPPASTLLLSWPGPVAKCSLLLCLPSGLFQVPLDILSHIYDKNLPFNHALEHPVDSLYR